MSLLNQAEAELLQAIVLLFQRLGITSSDVGIRVSSRKVANYPSEFTFSSIVPFHVFGAFVMAVCPPKVSGKLCWYCIHYSSLLNSYCQTGMVHDYVVLW